MGFMHFRPFGVTSEPIVERISLFKAFRRLHVVGRGPKVGPFELLESRAVKMLFGLALLPAAPEALGPACLGQLNVVVTSDPRRNHVGNFSWESPHDIVRMMYAGLKNGYGAFRVNVGLHTDCQCLWVDRNCYDDYNVSTAYISLQRSYNIIIAPLISERLGRSPSSSRNLASNGTDPKPRNAPPRMLPFCRL